MGMILGGRFRKWVNPENGDEGLTFWCEGCQAAHGIRTKGEGAWYWNGDAEKPVFGPSVLTRGKKKLTEEQYDRIRAGEKIEVPDEICHTFVGCNGAQPGEIIFLGDCTHSLAGQVRPFPELPDWLKD
jgi:hypothetical protein